MQLVQCREDALAAREADDGSRIPHAVALAIMDGERPVLAFRRHRDMTLCDLAARTGIAVGYLSEIERGLKPGSAAALSRIAADLPEPHVLAREIAGDLRSALGQMEDILADLEGRAERVE